MIVHNCLGGAERVDVRLLGAATARHAGTNHSACSGALRLIGRRCSARVRRARRHLPSDATKSV